MPLSNSLLWLKHGRRCVTISLLAPIRGSFPIRIWDTAGLSLWCLHCGDCFKEQESDAETHRVWPAYLRGSHIAFCIFLMTVGAWHCGEGSQRAFFMADTLTCYGKRSAGVINNITDGCSEFHLGEAVPGSCYGACWLTQMASSNGTEKSSVLLLTPVLFFCCNKWKCLLWLGTLHFVFENCLFNQ